jgi:hypothetical protein
MARTALHLRNQQAIRGERSRRAMEGDLGKRADADTGKASTRNLKDRVLIEHNPLRNDNFAIALAPGRTRFFPVSVNAGERTETYHPFASI